MSKIVEQTSSQANIIALHTTEDIKKQQKIGQVLLSEMTAQSEFQCKSPEVDMQQDTCVEYLEDSEYQAGFQIRPCKEKNSDNYCQGVNSYLQTSVCQKPPEDKSKKFPGMTCKIPSDCYSNTCRQNEELDQHLCIGKVINQPCQGDESPECDVGLACINFSCQQQIKPYLWGCNVDEQCVNYAVCVDHQCVEYYSVKNYEIMKLRGCRGDGREDACASATCTPFGDGAMCIPAFVNSQTLYLKDKVPFRCQLDEECVGINSEGFKLMIPCECGLNNKSQDFS